jgi:GntR family transcriptional repressor for pyruvate dehydrogenase complex
MLPKPQRLINRFQEIKVQKPAEGVIEQIKNLIVSGDLTPGDRLPAERILADKTGVGRGHVREALKRLELEGIVKILPQSGAYVTDLNAKSAEGLILGVLNP